MKKSLPPILTSPALEKIGSMIMGSARTVLDRIHNPRRLLLYFSIMLIGLAASRFANSIIMYMLSSKLQVIAPAASVFNAPQRQAAMPASYDLSSIIDGVFFRRAAVESRSPDLVATPELKNFSLIGTLEGDPSFARAVIRIQGEKEEPREYGIGEKIGAAMLIAIGYEKIWIRINGDKFKIEVGENIQDIQSKAAASTPGGDVSKVISRQEINEKILGNPAAIYGGGAAFGPNLVNGKIEGFRLHRIPENHIFYTLGARSGDIIKSVNGYALSNTSQMMELWNNIKTMPRVSVELERDGKPLKYDFEVRN